MADGSGDYRLPGALRSAVLGDGARGRGEREGGLQPQSVSDTQEQQGEADVTALAGKHFTPPEGDRRSDTGQRLITTGVQEQEDRRMNSQ